MQASEILKEVNQQVAICVRCNLHMSRKFSVPGEGPADASILFIGEGPGFHENESGRPFVGQAGKLLDELLRVIELERKQVYITNVVKCRPPGNRDPFPDELAACNDYLERQIAAINPKIIVTLGRYSMAKFLPNAKVSGVHGKSYWVKGRLIVPMYHPAAALHQPTLKPALETDFQMLPGYIEQAKTRPAQPAQTESQSEPAPKETAEQLNLF